MFRFAKAFRLVHILSNGFTARGNTLFALHTSWARDALSAIDPSENVLTHTVQHNCTSTSSLKIRERRLGALPERPLPKRSQLLL